MDTHQSSVEQNTNKSRSLRQSTYYAPLALAILLIFTVIFLGDYNKSSQITSVALVTKGHMNVLQKHNNACRIKKHNLVEITPKFNKFALPSTYCLN